MFQDDWDRLAIAPTDDLAAIKKAYARKLRVTRPDDDAEAYQALRAAYERAQQWAHWQQRAAEHTAWDDAAATPAAQPVPQADTRTAADTPAPSHTEAEAAPEAPAEPEPVQQLHPDTLIEHAELTWRREGPAGLMAAWPALQQTLSELPLARQAEFSAAFANWVIKLPQLPDQFVSALNDHFAWLSDFRTARDIGEGLSQALHDALEGRLPEAPPTPEMLARAAPLMQLHALLAHGAGARAVLWAAVIGPALKMLKRTFDVATFLRLGLEPQAQLALDTVLGKAGWLRASLAVLLFIATALLLGHEWTWAVATLLRWGVGSAFLLAFGMLIGSLVLFGLGGESSHDGSIQVRLSRWCAFTWLGPASIALLLAVSFGFGVAEVPFDRSADAPTPVGAFLFGWFTVMVPMVLVSAFLLLAWPQQPVRGWVVAGLAPMISLLFHSAFGKFLPALACVGLGMLWLLLGSLVHEARLPANALVRALVRPVLNNLALGDRWGYVFAMLPPICVLAAVFLPVQMSAGTAALIWVLSILAVGYGQARLEQWGLKRLARSADQRGT